MFTNNFLSNASRPHSPISNYSDATSINSSNGAILHSLQSDEGAGRLWHDSPFFNPYGWTPFTHHGALPSNKQLISMPLAMSHNGWNGVANVNRNGVVANNGIMSNTIPMSNCPFVASPVVPFAYDQFIGQVENTPDNYCYRCNPNNNTNNNTSSDNYCDANSNKRTPCTVRWWDYVLDEMTWVTSPRDVELTDECNLDACPSNDINQNYHNTINDINVQNAIITNEQVNMNSINLLPEVATTKNNNHNNTRKNNLKNTGKNINEFANSLILTNSNTEGNSDNKHEKENYQPEHSHDQEYKSHNEWKGERNAESSMMRSQLYSTNLFCKEEPERQEEEEKYCEYIENNEPHHRLRTNWHSRNSLAEMSAFDMPSQNRASITDYIKNSLMYTNEVSFSNIDNVQSEESDDDNSSGSGSSSNDDNECNYNSDSSTTSSGSCNDSSDEVNTDSDESNLNNTSSLNVQLMKTEKDNKDDDGNDDEVTMNFTLLDLNMNDSVHQNNTNRKDDVNIHQNKKRVSDARYYKSSIVYTLEDQKNLSLHVPKDVHKQEKEQKRSINDNCTYVTGNNRNSLSGEAGQWQTENMEVSVVNRNRNARPSLFEVDSELERLSAAPRPSIINNRAYHESSEYDCVNELSFSGEQIHNQEEVNNNSNKNDKYDMKNENINKNVIVVPSLECKQRRSTIVNKNDRRRESKNGPDTENKNDTSLIAVSAFVLDDADNDDSVYPKTCNTTKSSSSHQHYDKEEQNKCQHDNNKETKQKKSSINNKDIEENVKKRKSCSYAIITEPSTTSTTIKVEANSTSEQIKDEEKDKKAKSKDIAQNTRKDSEEKLKLPMIADRNRFISNDLTKDKNAKYDTSDKKTSIHLLSPQGENELANKKVSVTSSKVLPQSIANAELRRESNTLVTTKAHDDEKKLMLNKWPLYQYEQEEQLEQQESEEEYRLPLRDLIASSFKKQGRSEDNTDAINGNINKKLSNNNFPLNDEECKSKKEKEGLCYITINEESKSQENNNDNKKSINKKKKNKSDCKTVENTKVSTIPQQNQEKQSEVNAKSTLPISKIKNDNNNSNNSEIKDKVACKRGKVENCEPKQKESANSYIAHSSHPADILQESESKNNSTKNNNNNNNNNNDVNESSNNVFADYNHRSHTLPLMARLSAIEVDDGTHCMATTATSLKKIKYKKNKSITLLDDNNSREHKSKEEKSVKLEVNKNVREKEKEKKKDVYNYFCDNICLYTKSSRKKLSICSTHANLHTENNEKHAQTMNEWKCVHDKQSNKSQNRNIDQHKSKTNNRRKCLRSRNQDNPIACYDYVEFVKTLN